MPRLEPNIWLDTSNDSHNYIDKDGNIVKLPSVTELVGYIYPFKIEEIDPHILWLGRQRGNCLHKRLETYIKTKIITPCKCILGKEKHDKYFNNAKNVLKSIIKKYDVIEVDSEVSLTNNLFTGTIDLFLLTKSGEWIIIDFKTTSWNKKEDEEKDIIRNKEALQLLLYTKLFTFVMHKKIKQWIIINPNKANYGYSISEDLKIQAKKDWNKIKKIYNKI